MLQIMQACCMALVLVIYCGTFDFLQVNMFQGLQPCWCFAKNFLLKSFL